MAIEALGRVFDISTGIVPVDLQTAQTGKRVRLYHSTMLTIVVFKAAGTAGDDPVFTLQQHTASSGGTTANLAIIDHYHYKAATTLAGTETWTTVTQTASQTLSDPGGLGTSAESQMIIVIPVGAPKLSDGYAYVSMNIADTGTNAQLGSVLYFLSDLQVSRKPANLVAGLN